LLIKLHNGPAKFTIDTKGAYIRTWQVGRHIGLYSNPDKPNRATHPCGPNFGPLSLNTPKDGEYTVGEKKYKLPQHGFLREREWRIDHLEQSSVILSLQNTHENFDKQLFDAYPYNFRFLLALKLSAGKLIYELSFTNLNEAGCAPVDLASHTYHPLEPGMTIKGLSGLKYIDNLDPSAPPQELKGDLKEELLGGSQETNPHFWTEGRKKFILDYPQSGKRITLRTGYGWGASAPERIVVWSKPSEGNFVCVEPLIHGANSFNLNRKAVEVPPGKTVSLSFMLNLMEI